VHRAEPVRADSQRPSTTRHPRRTVRAGGAPHLRVLPSPSSTARAAAPSTSSSSRR
jgi:hypothetical protein